MTVVAHSSSSAGAQPVRALSVVGRRAGWVAGLLAAAAASVGLAERLRDSKTGSAEPAVASHAAHEVAGCGGPSHEIQLHKLHTAAPAPGRP